MVRPVLGWVLLGMSIMPGVAPAQSAPAVDFARDVLPLFRQNCVGCHGPLQQAGLRFDRKSSVLKSFTRRVVPGSSANSFVYHRLVGSEYGKQMPPTGALRPELIAIVKAWIDQGAEWPDALANNKVDLPPSNPKALAMVEALRSDDLRSFLKTAAADPALLNSRGPEGSTPFMYAVLLWTRQKPEVLAVLREPTPAPPWLWSQMNETESPTRDGDDVQAASRSVTQEKWQPLTASFETFGHGWPRAIINQR